MQKAAESRSAAKPANHLIYRSGICAKQLQDRAGNARAEPMKIDECENKCDSEQNSGDKAPDVAAFIGSQFLQKSVKNQGDHEQEDDMKPGTAVENRNGYACNHTHELARAPRADRKLLPPEKKGAIRPGVASEENLQEFSEFSRESLQRLPLR